jgi:hypothetical protein
MTENKMVGVKWTPENPEMIDIYWNEISYKTIRRQKTMIDTYHALRAQGVPIPPDLKHEVEAALPRWQYSRVYSAIRYGIRKLRKRQNG